MRKTYEQNKAALDNFNWDNLQKLITGTVLEEFLRNWLDSVAEGLLQDGMTIEDAINELRQQAGSGGGQGYTFNKNFFTVLNGFVDLAYKYIAINPVEGVDMNVLNLLNTAEVTMARINGVTVCTLNTDYDGVSVTGRWQKADFSTIIPAGSKVRVRFEAKHDGMTNLNPSAYNLTIFGAGYGMNISDDDHPVGDAGVWTTHEIEYTFNGAGPALDDCTMLMLSLRRVGSDGDYTFPQGSTVSFRNIVVEYSDVNNTTGGLNLPVANLLLKTAGATPELPPAGAKPGDDNYDVTRHLQPGQIAFNSVDKILFYNNGIDIEAFQAANPKDKGWFPTEAALRAAHPAGQDGWFAIIGTTDTFWTWDRDTPDWVDTGSSQTPINVDAVPTKGSTNAVTSGGVYKLFKETFKVESITDTGIITLDEAFKVTSITAQDGLTVTIKKSDGTDYTIGDNVAAFDYLEVSGDTLNKVFTVRGEIV